MDLLATTLAVSFLTHLAYLLDVLFCFRNEKRPYSSLASFVQISTHIFKRKKTKGPISKRKIKVILTEVTNIRFTVVGEIEDFRALTFKKMLLE